MVKGILSGAVTQTVSKEILLAAGIKPMDETGGPVDRTLTSSPCISAPG